MIKSLVALASALLLLFLASLAPSMATDLSQYCGHPISGRNIRLVGEPLDAKTCTANCIRFTLTCGNGQRFSLASQYNPYDPDWLNFLSHIYPLPQGIFFAGILFLAFAMLQGGQPSFSANATYLAIVGLAMYFWPAVASYPKSFTADMTAIAIGMSVLGFPIFVVLNIKALVRGWNYLFAKHAAQPIVGSALRSQGPIDTRALGRTLAAQAYDSEEHPVYYYENQAAKARVLRDRIDAARSEVAAAERALEEAQQRAERQGSARA